MTRAVVAVSVLVSAAITPRNTRPHRVVQAWADRHFDLVASPRVLGELARAPARPKLARYLTTPTAASFVDVLERDAVLLQDPSDVPPATRDPDDDYLVALARRPARRSSCRAIATYWGRSLQASRCSVQVTS